MAESLEGWRHALERRENKVSVSEIEDVCE